MGRTDLWTDWEDSFLMEGNQHLLNRTPDACKKRRLLLQKRGYTTSANPSSFNPAVVAQAFNAWPAPGPAQLVGVV